MIIIALVIIIYIIFYFLINRNYTNKHIYKKWYQCLNNNSGLNLFRNVLENNNVKRTYGNDWDVYLPCKNNYSEKEFVKIKTNNPNQQVSYISRNGVIGSKQYIWKMLVRSYGRDKSKNIMPESFIFPQDLKEFNKSYKKNKLYMMKSEKQRQTGLKLSNNYNEIINSHKNGYKIVQEYIYDSLTYNNYKLNFRIYILIVCNGFRKNTFIYNDGIISYSKEKLNYVHNFDNGVASFYTSKDLYQSGYPITLKELRKAKKNVNWNYLFDKFIDQIKLVVNASNSLICKSKLNYNNQTFQIFGVDFLVTNNFKPYILEINIGPGMSPFCERDKSMRINLHTDMLKIVNIIKSDDIGGFIKII